METTETDNQKEFFVKRMFNSIAAFFTMVLLGTAPAPDAEEDANSEIK